MMACERGAADRDVRAVVLHLLYRGADENRTYIGPYRSDRALVPRNITVKEMARQSWHAPVAHAIFWCRTPSARRYYLQGHYCSLLAGASSSAVRHG